MKYRLSLMVGLALMAFPIDSSEPPSRVGMIQLLANPEKYDTQLVLVTGFLHLSFESDALYLHQDDYEHALFDHALWVESSDKMNQEKDKISGTYVAIVGWFSSKPSGSAQHPGAIRRIVRYSVWSRPEEPATQRFRGLKPHGQ